MNGIVEFVRTLGAARLAAMGAVAAALIFFFLFIIARVTTPAMAPLFTELSLDDSGRIVRELETQGIQYEIKHDGATIMVPKDKIARTRMRLAETGLPRGGNVGYEIFDRTDTLGTTSFVQNVNRVRALEGELARTIRSIDRIAAARVHLVIPERQLFSRDQQEPSASIVLQVRGSLEMSQVRAIRHLVASAVRGLKTERISIVDERGQLLADGSSETTSGITGMEERNAAFERKMKEQIEAIVTSVVGANRARVTVSAELDYTRIQQTSDSFDPESRVVRSTQTREEQSTTANSQNNDGVTVANEIPGNNQPRNPQQQQPQQPRDNARKTEEVVNYEITRTTRTETLEPGRVKRISVAVLVDGNYTKGNNNEVAYAPRSKEELDRITALVRSAIGFNEKRGDMIEVVNLRFAEPTVIPPASADTGFLSMLRFTTDDIMRFVEIGVMMILGLLVLLFVVRPLVRRVITPEENATGALAPAAANVPALAPPGGQHQAVAPPLAPAAPSPRAESDHPAARLIESAQIQGEAHQKSMQKVGELVQNNPQETVSVLRQWMNERTA
ncbi:MAG: flagellar M-ring protein FliF [Xanthobacteraceae bacterium]|nr:flagellar M-ring protein FliF [Xanthobacteraceae bacterium]